MKFIRNNIAGLALIAFGIILARVSLAQTLTPVTAPAGGGGIPWWAGPLAGVIIVGIGFAYLKFKKPAVAAKIETGADAIGKIAAEAAKAAVAHLQANPPVAGSVELAAIPATDPLQPQLEAATKKLADIKAILDA